ncbi:MAG: hypothetical protein Q8O56_00600 [Solirubrobacteraceae bacterium]|nr:hypothetical protein [Solirubrobacteraceae bacterium]
MTRPIRRTTTGLLGLGAAAVAALTAVALVGTPSHAQGSRTLNGTFKLAPGKYSGGKASGTYFRMITGSTGGKRQYLDNPDSRARDKSYTLGRPGREGGLATGRFQSHPNPPFDSKGNARANRIIRPEPYTAIRFSVATLRKDPQTNRTSAVTRATLNGRRITLRVPGFTAEWNGQYFNQGAPKPDGSGRAATGTYNPKTKRFVITWTSKISGGPFNGFSGFWHLEGTFKPR